MDVRSVGTTGDGATIVAAVCPRLRHPSRPDPSAQVELVFGLVGPGYCPACDTDTRVGRAVPQRNNRPRGTVSYVQRSVGPSGVPDSVPATYRLPSDAAQRVEDAVHARGLRDSKEGCPDCRASASRLARSLYRGRGSMGTGRGLTDGDTFLGKSAAWDSNGMGWRDHRPGTATSAGTAGDRRGRALAAFGGLALGTVAVHWLDAVVAMVPVVYDGKAGRVNVCAPGDDMQTWTAYLATVTRCRKCTGVDVMELPYGPIVRDADGRWVDRPTDPTDVSMIGSARLRPVGSPGLAWRSDGMSPAVAREIAAARGRRVWLVMDTTGTPLAVRFSSRKASQVARAATSRGLAVSVRETTVPMTDAGMRASMRDSIGTAPKRTRGKSRLPSSGDAMAAHDLRDPASPAHARLTSDEAASLETGLSPVDVSGTVVSLDDL